MIIGLHRARGNKDSSLGGHKQNLDKTQREGAMSPQETDPKLSASVGGSPVEVWVSSGFRRDDGTGSSPGKRLLA